MLLSGYWPWWLSGAALAGVVLLLYIVDRRLLGVSGSIGRVVRPDFQEEETVRAINENPDAFQEALLAATKKEFGEQALSAEEVGEESVTGAAGPRGAAPASRLPWSVHVTFILAMVGGGVFASLLMGDWSATWSLGATYEELIGSGPVMWLTLVLGGVLTGFGTRMSGGCTSGHGLTGCGRLQPGSLAGTAAFFGTAVVVSLLLSGVAG